MYYFPSIVKAFYSIQSTSRNSKTRENHWHIQVDKAVKIMHINFWLTVASAYPTLIQKPISQLITFLSSWECNQGFSAMTVKIMHINFWLTVAFAYPTLIQKPISQLIAFLSSWECNQKFSAMIIIKTKVRINLYCPSMTCIE